LQVAQHFLNIWIVIEADVESNWAALNLRHEEKIIYCYLVPEIILASGILQHGFNSLHSSNNPVPGPLYFIALVIIGNFFKTSQILIRMNSRVDNLAKATDLCF